MNIAELTAAWLTAKADENAANKRRLEIEAQIVAALPPTAPEASVSAKIGDYAISVRYGVTRKVDADKLGAMWDELPAKAREAFKWTAAPVLPKLRGLMEYAPAEYARVAACIEAKPSKPSVSVDVLEKEAA